MQQSIPAIFKAVFVSVMLIMFSHAVRAQTANSRVSAVVSNNKTSIWITDFPKQTEVVLTDSDNNLLSIITTNNYGAAYISLTNAIGNTITVKTFNGEVSASNKVAIAGQKDENLTSVNNTAANGPKA